MNVFLLKLVLLWVTLNLLACGRAHQMVMHDATVKIEPKSRQGNPEFYTVLGKRYFVLPDSRGYREQGIASWYGKKFHGRNTSNGETYDMYQMTAAHKTLPLPTYVEVKNLENGKRVVLRVNDRGPFHDNRIIDLSYSAALKLDIVKNGTGLVEVRAIDPRNQGMASDDRVRPAVDDIESLKDDKRFHNKIFIQVGAFSDKGNAVRVMNDLLAKRLFHVNVVSGSGGAGHAIHRVRIGPMHTIKNTDSAVAALEGLGYKDYQIVID